MANTHRQWTIHDVTAATGLTSRTLRHYDAIGLLPPSATRPGGLRCYDQDALVRLQRILLWRELGVPVARIAELLAGEVDDVEALSEHRDQLRRDQIRLADQLAAVEATITALREGEQLMPTQMFDGFDHRQYDAEVRQRWGEEAADRSQQWWDGLGTAGQQAFRADLEDLNNAWDEVIGSGDGPASEAAQAVAARHLRWLGSTWQAPEMPREAVEGIAHMYVEDERFAKNYTRVSPDGAKFVRDALLHRLQA